MAGWPNGKAERCVRTGKFGNGLEDMLYHSPVALCFLLLPHSLFPRPSTFSFLLLDYLAPSLSLHPFLSTFCISPSPCGAHSISQQYILLCVSPSVFFLFLHHASSINSIFSLSFYNSTSVLSTMPNFPVYFFLSTPSSILHLPSPPSLPHTKSTVYTISI